MNYYSGLLCTISRFIGLAKYINVMVLSLMQPWSDAHMYFCVCEYVRGCVYVSVF